MHWILGTIISIVGIINIYTGLNAYHKKTSRSIGLWTVLFTAEISFVGFFYLFQDKWEFLQKQGVVLGESEAVSPTDEQVETQRQNSKELLPDPCTKQNALRNLFDWYGFFFFFFLPIFLTSLATMFTCSIWLKFLLYFWCLHFVQVKWSSGDCLCWWVHASKRASSSICSNLLQFLNPKLSPSGWSSCPKRFYFDWKLSVERVYM